MYIYSYVYRVYVFEGRYMHISIIFVYSYVFVIYVYIYIYFVITTTLRKNASFYKQQNNNIRTSKEMKLDWLRNSEFHAIFDLTLVHVLTLKITVRKHFYVTSWSRHLIFGARFCIKCLFRWFVFAAVIYYWHYL